MTSGDVIRFRIARGSFRIPLDLKANDPDEWARRFASSMPDSDRALTSSVRDGEVEVVTWRIVTPYVCDY